VSTEQILDTSPTTTIATPASDARTRLRRGMLVVCGTMSLGLGILGIFVPLLPTTCFLLAAAWCYARSSPRLYGRLLGSRYIGSYLRRYRDEQAIPARVKSVSLVIMWISIGYGVLTFPNTLVRVALLGVAIAVTVHLVRLPTARATE
jgi:uncharacterized protein